MSETATRSIELLAPAGNVAALHAAVRGGADAVYLGLESFNARRGADNFTLETLARACDYAHLRGVRVYLTMNTVILPDELDDALECARQAWRAGADAFIVQDIGFASELHRTLPAAELHISTQMNIHNDYGIEAAAALGASRVTLARELSSEEIAHLASTAAAYGMEVEVFAHGALCICYSGQCFMSSLIGGRSANRGRCAQACRLPYTLHNVAQRKPLDASGDHLLSPADLCLIDDLVQLEEAGVASIKIEGRMKSPEYVMRTAEAYRAVLDRLEGKAAGAPQATAVERESLETVFSRGLTTAYFSGERGNDMMSYQRPNNRGAFVGRVRKANGRTALISTDVHLRKGDVIEFWTRKGHSSLMLPQEPHENADGTTEVALDAKTRTVRDGDRVFRVRSSEAAFDDDPLAPRLLIDGRVTLREGKPLAIEFSLADPAAHERPADAVTSASAQGPVVEAARTRALVADEVREHVARMGSTPYALRDLRIDLDDNVGLGFSTLHHCRAEALDRLTENLLAPYHARSLPRIDRAKAAAAPALFVRKTCTIAALATNPKCARAAKRAGADTVYVPALNYLRGQAVVAGQLIGEAGQTPYPKHCVLVMPVADHEPIGASREAAMGLDAWAHAAPPTRIMVESLAGMQRAADEGLVFEVGPHVPCTNRASLDAAASLGATKLWLSPELDLEQIASLGKATPIELGIVVQGTQELMTCEHCLLMSQGPCNQDCLTCARRKSPHYLEDRKGFRFPVITDALGRSHLHNSVMLDTVSILPDLIAAGVTSFLVDTTCMNTEEAAQAVGRAKHALDVALRDGNSLAKLPGTTAGHLFRGVS